MTQLPPPTAGPAGWYPDPHGGPTARYFDGRRWAPVEAPAFAPARPPHPTLPARAAVGALVILVASLVAGRLLIDALADTGWPIIVYVAILTVVGYGPSVWWCHHVSARWGSGRLADDVGLRFRWVDLAWGLVIWVAAVACEIVVAAAVLATGIPTSSNTEGVSELQADRSYVVALLVTAVIAAPLVEEMVFRGVVLRGLLGRTGPALAIVAQALLFGLAHVDPVRGAGNVGLAVILSGVGVALGGGAYLLRRIGPTIVAHAIFNAVVLTIVLTGVADRLQDELDDATVAPVPAAAIDTVAPVDALSRPAPTAPAAVAPGR